MNSAHTLASLPACCQVCGGEGVLVLETHFIADCALPTPTKVVCPHCSSEQRFPIHHYHQREVS